MKQEATVRIATAQDAIAREAGSMLTDPERLFSHAWNRRSFRFGHRLKDHPVFSLDHIVAFTARFPDGHFWSNGAAGVVDGWKSVRRDSLSRTLERVAENDSLVVLKHVERDDAMGPLLNSVLDEALSRAGPGPRADVTITRATLLVASPRRLTAYHIDAETNFLLQIAGDKHISVFDHRDRSLITHEELEGFYAGDMNGVPYREERQADANVHELRAGDGIHIPVAAPHWAQNGDKVSIALSINFNLRSVRQLARVYCMNRLLRRSGIEPLPPSADVSAWRDRLKLAAANLLMGSRLLKKGPYWL